jgi:hypothetical protein
MHPSHEFAIEVEAETNLGETTATFATLRLPHKGALDLTLSQEKIDPEIATQYRNDGTKHIQGPMGGTLKTRTYLTGHGSSTAGGGLALSAYETFLGNVIGNATLSSTAGTTASGGTATALTTAAANGFGAGALFRLGVLGDGRGNGQAGMVVSHAANTLTSAIAFDAAPSGTDPVYSGANLYPSENPTTTSVTSYRMRVITANDKYELHGCVPVAYTITELNTGQAPVIEITWAIAWWKRVTTGTFPSVLATEPSLPAPVAAGSFFFNTVVAGTPTATRNKLVVRDFKFETTMGMETQNGPGGFDPNQVMVSARRTEDKFKITFMVDAEANTASPAMDTAWLQTGTTFHHACYNLNAVDGKGVTLYFPKLEVCGARPVQKIDSNVNRYEVTAYAYTGQVTTSDLTLSAFRMLFS